jgi:iron complex outermembrane receptor protein
MIQTVERKNVNTGEIENYGVELEAAYRLNSHWSLNTNHSLLHMENPVIAAPTYKGFVGADYRCQRLTVNTALQYISGLYTAVGQAEQKEDFCLLSISATYAVAKGLSLWARGENLLAQRYEINLGYPMPRATFMGGISWRF